MRGSSRVRRLIRTERPKKVANVDAHPVALGYVRVSTDGQFAEGYGIDVQENAIRTFASSQGYELLNVIPDCVSGALPPPERPGFQQVLRLAEEKQFSILLVHKFDRLARNVLHAVTSVHMLRDRFGIALRSVSEPIDTATPMGEMIFTVLASMAAQERQTITERTWGGRKEKARKGGLSSGYAPYGYLYDKDGGLHPSEDEAAVVRRMFEMRAQGQTLAAITATLNADGIRTRRGGAWRISSVAYLLDNPRYKGASEHLFRWNGASEHIMVLGAHEAIVA